MLSWWPLLVLVVAIIFFIPLRSVISLNCSFHRAHFSLSSLSNHSLLWDQLFFIILAILIHSLVSFISGDPCVFLRSRNWEVGWLFWADGMDFIYREVVGMFSQQVSFWRGRQMSLHVGRLILQKFPSRLFRMRMGESVTHRPWAPQVPVWKKLYAGPPVST